jgi:hypothetical protein
LEIDRQMELLGIQDPIDQQDLRRHTLAWLLKSVLKPAAEIAVNPAASCAEAQLILTKVLEIGGQQQLLGVDDSAYSFTGELVELIQTALARRCHEEALDECVYTGRMNAVTEQALAEERQRQLLGLDNGDTSWVTDALNQCAIYKLKFTSTGNVTGTATQEGYEREVEGTVTLHPGLGNFQLPGDLPAGIGFMLQPELMQPSGTDSSALLTSATCQGTDPNPAANDGRVVVDFCGSVGIDKGPTSVLVKAFDLSHFTYEVTGVDFATPGSDKVKMSVVGQDQLMLLFTPGPISAVENSHIEIQGRELPSTDSTPEVFASIYAGAHYKELGEGVVFPPGSAPSILSHRKDDYPVLLSYTLEGTSPKGARDEIYTDTTVFEFSHEPEPKPFAPRDTSIVVRIDQKIDELSANLQ